MLDQQKITILYCRLSNEDAQDGESNSIANQREYLTRYDIQNQFKAVIESNPALKWPL